jgi:hypothetical protein
MSDDMNKLNAKTQFAIDAARPAIQAASEAMHELKIANKDQANFAFDYELAWVVKRLPALCPHHLRVLNLIINVLLELAEHGHEHEPQQASH